MIETTFSKINENKYKLMFENIIQVVQSNRIKVQFFFNDFLKYANNISSSSISTGPQLNLC